MPPLRLTHEAMMTEFVLVMAGDDPDYLREVAGDAFHELDRLDGILTRFDPSSEIGQINLLAPGASRRTCPEVIECLLTALWANTETAGAFDICVGMIMDCWRDGDGHVRSKEPDPDEISEAQLASGMSRLILDPEEQIVGVAPGESGLSTGGLGIDLGGIGKGYALDKLAIMLEERKVTHVLLHSASTILALGADPAEDAPGWSVGVGGQWGKQAGIGHLQLQDRALSCSGTDVKGNHVMNPKQGRPAASHQAAWAISPSAAVADALSTAFMVMDTQAVAGFCEKHAEIAAFIVKNDRLLRFDS